MNDHVGIPKSVQRLGRRLYELAYRWRRSVAYAAYGLVAAGAYALAFWIDFDFAWHSGLAATFLGSAALLLAIHLVCAAVGLSGSRLALRS